METERIAVAVRPREGYEAVDLGFRSRARCLAAVPRARRRRDPALALACSLALPNQLWLARAIVWWLKPLYDRVALAVLADALLGRTPANPRDPGRPAAPGLRDGSRARRSPGCGSRRCARSRRRCCSSRGCAGARARAACACSVGRESSAALGLFFACVHFELVILFAGLQLAATLQSRATRSRSSGRSRCRTPAPGSWRSRPRSTCWPICAIEPLYVAGGFALYINRRVWLEGWDVELAFRRLAAARCARCAALAGVALALALAAPAPAHAAPEPPRALSGGPGRGRRGVHRRGAGRARVRDAARRSSSGASRASDPEESAESFLGDSACGSRADSPSSSGSAPGRCSRWPRSCSRC